MYVCVYVCTYVCMYVCICIRMYFVLTSPDASTHANIQLFSHPVC